MNREEALRILENALNSGWAITNGCHQSDTEVEVFSVAVYELSRIDRLEKMIESLNAKTVGREIAIRGLMAANKKLTDENMQLKSNAERLVKHSKWIKHGLDDKVSYWCEKCGCVAPCTEMADAFVWKLSNYCPDCGSDMTEDREATHVVVPYNEGANE